MKITFIYDYKDGEVWSTPMSLVNEFKKRSWEVDIIKTNDTDLKNWVDSKPETDIVMFMDWGRFDSQYLNKELVPAFWIQESGDDPQNFERNFPKAERFHLTITPAANSAEEYKNRGINVLWIPHWADIAVQFPLENIEKKYVAVTSRGPGGSQFLDYLTNWAEGVIGNRNGMDAKEHTKFLNSGLMVIQNSRWKEVTRRLFEGMACGKLVITDRLPEEAKLNELFVEGEEIVLYNDMFDCIEKINYYNENEQERERIAYNGLQKVLNNYTQIHIVDKLIKEYESFNNRSSRPIG
jgi:glycosyltransferase involved in cell wall biosynthesis